MNEDNGNSLCTSKRLKNQVFNVKTIIKIIECCADSITTLKKFYFLRSVE
jgi:hypothetical protein